MMTMTASMSSVGGSAGNGGQTVSVPPGFRFHPTDEELLYYYLKKKVAYEVIDLDVIRDVDLNKLEPWDLKDKCRIGSGPQNEWYFFSHKDKKYPTGTRTNRATNAGFWKATGRDKAIHLSNMIHANVDADASSYSNKRIGMRKTLVFYTGRAPHGQKTDWIMHEYRLDEENDNHHHHHLHNSDHIQVQEDGWVVCRVFKKKNHQRGFQQQHLAVDHHQVVEADHEHHHQAMQQYFNPVSHMDDDDTDEPTTKRRLMFPQQPQYGGQQHFFDGSMHLPQLLSPEKTSVACTAPPPPISLPQQDINEYCSSHHQSLMKLLTSNVVGGSSSHLIQQAIESGGSRNYKYAAGTVGGSDWSFLDKLLAGSHQSLDQFCQTKCIPPSATAMSMQVVHDDNVAAATTHETKFPFTHHHHQYLGNYETDVSKFSNK